ncbi:MAG: outer membrane lipoprotein-sorting protein [Spirochaetota bacterium]
MRKILFVLITFVFSLILTYKLFAISGEEIVRKMQSRDTGRSVHTLVKMDLIEKDGNIDSRWVENWGIEYEKDLTKMVVVFHSPPSIKDTRFLQIENPDREDDKWIYLPALKRVRRIAASEGGQSFMGTDFTYDDMSERKVERDYHELIGEERIDGYDCYVVESKSKNPGDSQYSRAVRWIRKDIWMPVKAELYDKKGQLLKMATWSNIKNIQGYWTAMVTEMKNVQTLHATRLEIKKVVYDEAIPPGLFTTQFLMTGRP